LVNEDKCLTNKSNRFFIFILFIRLAIIKNNILNSFNKNAKKLNFKIINY